MKRTCLSIILAAGEGTRMRSARSKVLHTVAGLPLVGHAAAAAVSAGAERLALVTGRDAGDVEKAVAALHPDAKFYHQAERLGTAHAVLAAGAELDHGFDDVLVLFGDTPLLLPETLLSARAALAEGAAVAVLGFHTANPGSYGRLILQNGQLTAIREFKDASDEEKQIGFCNGGIMALAGAHAARLLRSIGNANSKGEYYLTDIVELAHAEGLRVTALEASETELLGVNTPVELAEAEARWQARRREEFMFAGVSMMDPASVFLAYDTQIAAGCRLEPNIVFGPGVSVGENTSIRAFCHIEGASIADNVEIGPFARLRPGTKLADNTKVGNFCETKNASVETGAKINHLSYIGDARIGAGANVGAGTITCNYDGVLKHFTDIGAGAFVGSNSALVAPLSIGDGAYIASGSVVTLDVPADALAIGRGQQVIKPDRGRAIRERNLAAKAAKMAASGK
ncbi:bifunctional UDP-N-acetylglucosamine diphosphorylase/glucosamine-1-phosphate N-acetyltransferase GlmU [Aureimonas fodinaquatilis]|uniref:Bifunctional protein GlmU n=1 Tax=Aureimonas fodinaquatilis TaxID=2565783 RepID=A0A5B0DUF7_9HYPH|nr:bifunctional UDP-N-acetylglucosamine diphosphorylase/glucosamine-1-phosphate N-acetyltransferase GlmU [Aureimonas fodinaquatilis]KAA0970447.1 bifunctional UDP-N-acetylglucosamine diphosphorylase/glucosamine-1-phosphate N-acetyltransferase GlmU [Aureimonas fodinaquatilis]